MWSSFKHVMRVCFGDEVRFFLVMTYLIIVLTCVFGV